MKDHIKIRLPGGNRLFVIRRMEKSRGWISPTPFDDLPFDLRHSSTLEIVLVGGPERTLLV